MNPFTGRSGRFDDAFRIALTLGAGISIGWVSALGCASHNTGLNLPLMSEAYQIIQHNYVDRSALKSSPMTYGAIAGMVDSLGDFGHSAFLPPEMVKELKTLESGSLKGIGVEIRMREGRVVIVAPIDDSPAQRAGLKAGEVILKVNGEDIGGWPLSRVVEHVSGPAGTKVQLTLLDPRSGRTRDIVLTRARIRIRNVTWARLPGTKTAHIRIAAFDNGVAKEFRVALKEVRGQNMDGIILDLRNNPGGILKAAVEVASEFLNGGNVLLVKDAAGRITPVPALKGGLATNLPVVVLVNQGSASAAEIVAGALRDSRGADLVGETTFGTGTVLGQFRLYDGSALLLAVEEWLTPKGESYWHKGITPQIRVSLPNDAVPLLPESEHDLTSEQLRSNPDQQVLSALDLLNGDATHEEH